MRTGNRLTGRGTLRVDGRDLGSVSYDLEVSVRRGSPAAVGTIEGHAAQLHAAATSNAEHLVLVLEEGGEVQIALSRADFATGRADVRSSGPIAGF